MNFDMVAHRLSSVASSLIITTQRTFGIFSGVRQMGDKGGKCLLKMDQHG